jgi:hypothetical protein
MKKSIVLGEGKKTLSKFDTLYLRNNSMITTIYVHSDVENILPATFSMLPYVKEIIFQSGSRC